MLTLGVAPTSNGASAGMDPATTCSPIIEPNGFVTEYTTEVERVDEASHIYGDAKYWDRLPNKPDRCGLAGAPPNGMQQAMSGALYGGMAANRSSARTSSAASSAKGVQRHAGWEAAGPPVRTSAIDPFLPAERRDRSRRSGQGISSPIGCASARPAPCGQKPKYRAER